MPYGRTLLPTSQVFPTRVSADGKPLYKAGGITIDTTLITAAAGTDTTLPDGSVIKATMQYLRYGQILARIGAAEVQTITMTGGPTTGSAVINVGAIGDNPATTVTVPATATGAAVQTLLQAVQQIGVNGATVARTGSGTAGDPYIYTITYNKNLPDVPALTLASSTLSGGTTPTATLGTTTDTVANTGKFGPYDPAATDGRQTLTRGECVILDSTLLLYPSGPTFAAENDIQGQGIEGGSVWRNRILQSEAQTHSLARGPTFAELIAAFPLLQFYQN